MSITIPQRSLDKPMPHPILDNPSKVMRIIANPLYDKLTISRAAQLRTHQSPETRRVSSTSIRSKDRSSTMSVKTTDIDQTIITPLSNPADTNHTRLKSNVSAKRKTSLSFRLPTPGSLSRNTPSASPSRATTARSTTAQSIQTALVNSNSDPRKPLADGTIRYVNSRHGFEVQKRLSRNWLSTDIFTKDACQSHEKTFREMLDKKHQYERLSRSIYSSEYYTKRWHELLESYQQGYLSHTEWAKQNYQLLCLRTLYMQAMKREQRAMDLDARDRRKSRAKSAYQQWKVTKDREQAESQHGHMTTAQSRRRTEGTSILLNDSFSIRPSTNTLDENNTTLVDKSQRMSLSMSLDSDGHLTAINQPIISTKKPSPVEKALFLLDEQRWSLQAMLKRVVGLAEPLPAPTKVMKRKQSPVTNASNDSGFESVES